MNQIALRQNHDHVTLQNLLSPLSLLQTPLRQMCLFKITASVVCAVCSKPVVSNLQPHGQVFIECPLTQKPSHKGGQVGTTNLNPPRELKWYVGCETPDVDHGSPGGSESPLASCLGQQEDLQRTQV